MVTRTDLQFLYLVLSAFVTGVFWNAFLAAEPQAILLGRKHFGSAGTFHRSTTVATLQLHEAWPSHNVTNKNTHNKKHHTTAETHPLLKQGGMLRMLLSATSFLRSQELTRPTRFGAPMWNEKSSTQRHGLLRQIPWILRVESMITGEAAVSKIFIIGWMNVNKILNSNTTIMINRYLKISIMQNNYSQFILACAWWVLKDNDAGCTHPHGNGLW